MSDERTARLVHMTHRKATDIAWVPAGAEHFTGQVWFGPLTPQQKPEDLNVLAVAFSPGARSDWHSHPAGQVLYVVSGIARSQEQGGDTATAGPGDSIQAAPGVVHWHGAAPHAPMMHLSITHGGATEWLPRKVTDAEYDS